MKIAISGANGLIGSCLAHHFAEQGDSLTLLVRRPTESIHQLSIWNPYVGQISPADIDAHDVVINLAGKNVNANRWSESHKQEIVSSRVLATELIAKTLVGLPHKPKLLINASAIGYYGNRLDETVTEASAPGTGFMAESCVKWEAATQAAADAGIRVVCPRIGVVLTRQGGALEKLLPLFRLGLGGKLGSGKQMMSWIALAEIPLIFDQIIADASIKGGVNLTTPNPVSNDEFTQALAASLRRPAFFTVPAFALRIAVGELANELLLGGAKVLPQRLLDSGYKFRFTNLGRFLTEELTAD